MAEEYEKLLQAQDRDVHNDSKTTTLPVARAIVEAYIREELKLPWYIDLLNINLNNDDLATAQQRIRQYIVALKETGVRLTDNPDFRLP